MLNIPKPSETIIEDYYNSIKDRIIKAKNNSSLQVSAKNFLTESKIKEIICDEPQKLIKHHINIIPKLGIGFNLAEYNKYCAIRKKRRSSLNMVESGIFNKYDNAILELSNVFNYNKFISQDKLTSYNLATLLNRNTCTYCNRLYTNTIIVDKKARGKINDKIRLARPHFDHWYSKSRFHILALSFYNLIPSCYVCNSSIKGESIFSLKKHIHPYIDEPLPDFSFSYIHADIHEYNVKIDVKKPSKIYNTLEKFKIKEVYNSHSEFELKDLLELKYKYSENYLDTIFNKTFSIKVSKSEAYRMVFGVEYNEVDFHKRPFSKFKKDILKELGVIE